MALLRPPSSDHLFSLPIFDVVSDPPFTHNHGPASESGGFMRQPHRQDHGGASDGWSASSSATQRHHRCKGREAATAGGQKLGAQGDRNNKKRRKRVRMCKGKEEEESQRMTHIAIERNRRRQMKERIALLRSLMAETYVHRGDQASIIGGAIEFVKDLEHLLEFLESQKLQRHPRLGLKEEDGPNSEQSPPCGRPHQALSHLPSKYTSKSSQAAADIEVTLIQTHANVRILTQKSPRKLSQMVTVFHALCLTILHLNITTSGHLVRYSINAKVEERCQLSTVDDITGAVRHMLTVIEGVGVPDSIAALPF